MLRSAWIVLVATLALIGPAECSENRAATSRNEGKAHVAAFRPPAEVIVDDNGNLTDDGQRLLHYDYKNRLVAVSDKASMRPVAAYEYLPDGRRAKKVVFAADGSVAKATAFFYDGAQEVEEQDAGSGATEATYVWSPVYVDELVTYTNASGTYYTHQDARCDVVAITDAAGAVVERVRFDDFGRAEIRGPGGEVRAVSAVGCAYGFQGRRLDAETGLLYFRARMYDPETGRFVQRDPVWDAGNVGGQYTFCGNGPVSGRDPTGEFLLQALEYGVDAISKASKGDFKGAAWSGAKALGELGRPFTGVNAGQAAEDFVSGVPKEIERLENVGSVVTEQTGSVQEGLHTALGVGLADAVGISDLYEAYNNFDLGEFAKTGCDTKLGGWGRAGKVASGLLKIAGALAGAGGQSSRTLGSIEKNFSPQIIKESGAANKLPLSDNTFLDGLVGLDDLATGKGWQIVGPPDRPGDMVHLGSTRAFTDIDDAAKQIKIYLTAGAPSGVRTVEFADEVSHAINAILGRPDGNDAASHIRNFGNAVKSKLIPYTETERAAIETFMNVLSKYSGG